MRAWQGPKEGTPGSWTPNVKAARGEYVYIATSDDTMPPDCLTELVAALDRHPDCDIAHCTLKPIDEHGQDLADVTNWWRDGSMFALSSGPLIDQPHVRRAPFDGLLQLLGGSVFVSITQLLIRRSLFDRIGYFTSAWGSVGDFNWSMRAGLVSNVVHVPTTWGGWRLHSAQATAAVKMTSPEHASRIDAMIEDAIAHCEPFLEPAVRGQLRSEWVPEAASLRRLINTIGSRAGESVASRRAKLLRDFCQSGTAREYVTDRLLQRSPDSWVRSRLSAAGMATPLVVASTSSSAGRADAVANAKA